MKVATLPQTNIVNGAEDSIEMGFTREGMIQAARMFRDQIYTNKPWAVVREILANAIDEHRKHKVQRAVEITLPTPNDPHFRVRDFGKGCDKHKVFQTFFQYFASTKRSDDGMIGGFGIGAKSPLAYSDTFYVTSWYGGEEVLYVASLDGDSSKAYDMQRKDSNSPTGIEVAVPVADRDRESFRILVSYFVAMAKFQYFKVDGGELTPAADFLPQESIFSCDDGALVKWPQAKFKSHCNMYVRDGDIIYPIDRVDGLQTPFANCSVIVNIDRGKTPVDLAPSRERIDMSKRSIATINAATKKVQDAASAYVQARLAKCATAREMFAVQDAAKAISFALGKTLVEPWEMLHKTGGTCKIQWRDTPTAKGYRRLTSIADVCGRSWNRLKNLRPDHHNVLYVDSDTSPRIDAVVAFMKKQSGVSVDANDPDITEVYVLRRDASDLAPKHWVDGKDYWTYDEATATSEERKAVRDEYAPRAAVTSIVNGKSQASKTILAGATHHNRPSYYSNYDITLAEAQDKVANGNTLVVIPMSRCTILSKWDEKSEMKSTAGFVGENIFVLFSNQQEQKALGAANIPYINADEWHKAMFPKVKAKLATMPVVQVTLPNTLRSIVEELPAKNPARVELTSVATYENWKAIFPSLPSITPSSKSILTKILKRWEGLTDAEREFLKVIDNHTYWLNGSAKFRKHYGTIKAKLCDPSQARPRIFA